jgi:hypothetical protein
VDQTVVGYRLSALMINRLFHWWIRRRRLSAALASLSPSERACLRLRGQGCRLEAIAVKLRLADAREAAALLTSAIGQLRKALGPPVRSDRAA